MHCHFLETDAHLNKQPQQVIFSWWQTIFWLNCTGNNLRNLKEYPRWFVVLALRYAKGNTAEQTFLRLCSTFDLCLMGFRDPLALLIGLSSCLMGSLMPQTPSIEFSTHPLNCSPLSQRGFWSPYPRCWALPQNIGGPQQTWITHRPCKFNCISLKKGGKTRCEQVISKFQF